MSTEAAEADVRWRPFLDHGSSFLGDDDLATVPGRADAGGGVDRQADVAAVREGDEAAVDPDANSNRQILRPRSPRQRALNAHRSLDGRDDALEDGEELVGADFDLSSAGPQHGVANDLPHTLEQVRVAVAQLPQERGG